MDSIEVVYIEGKRNRVADGLSRTVFPEDGEDSLLASLGTIEEDVNGEPKWIWKDGKGGYEELLRLRKLQEFDAQKSSGIQSNFAPFAYTMDKEEEEMVRGLEQLCYNNQVGVHSDWYTEDEFFGQIFDFITMAKYPDTFDRLKKLALQRKSQSYRLDQHEGVLFVKQREEWKRCVPKADVAETLRLAHDCAGHWSPQQTLKKLRKYYWPNMVKDTVDYVLGCLKCAQHGRAQRSQKLSPIMVDKPNILLGMDFIGPLPATDLTREEALKCVWPQLHQLTKDIKFADLPKGKEGRATFTHILLIIDYFDRFVWAFPTIEDTQEEAIRCLSWLLVVIGICVLN